MFILMENSRICQQKKRKIKSDKAIIPKGLPQGTFYILKILL